MSLPAALFLCAALVVTPAFGAPTAVVDAVQMPAWVERGGRSKPLAPDMTLAAGDLVRTGADARVYLKLPEGSTVKLGENAVMSLKDMERKPGNLMTVALDVARGAFRFTTGVAAKLARRDVRIRVDAVSAGIRGTDLWGKSDGERDLVCLIEGRISVRHRDGEPVAMNEPLTFFAAPKGQPAQPVAPVDPDKLKQWAAETEIFPAAGAARRGGKWKLVLAAAADMHDARAVHDKARNAGYAAEMRRRSSGAKHSFDVLIRNLPSRAEADRLAQTVTTELGLAAAKPEI